MVMFCLSDDLLLRLSGLEEVHDTVCLFRIDNLCPDTRLGRCLLSGGCR